MKQFVKFLAWAGLLNPFLTFAQGGWAQIAAESEAAKTSLFTVAKNGCRIALALGLIFVIYSLADNKNYAKVAVISWFVGVGIYLMAFELINS